MLDPSNADLYLLCILAATTLFVIWHFYDSFQYWKRRNVPHLKPSFPYGNALGVFLNETSIGGLFATAYSTFRKEGHKHGGIYFSHTPVYVPVDPEIIKRIIISDAEIFPNRGLYISPKDPVSGHFFNMEGEKWRTLRSKTPSSFTSLKMRKMFSIMTNMIDSYVKLLESQISGPINIKPTISRLTTDMVSACLLGVETNTMKFENEELLQHGRHFFDYGFTRYKLGMIFCIPRYILEKFNFRMIRRGTENYTMDMFKKVYDNRKKGGFFRDDLTDSLVKLTEKSDKEKSFSGKTVMDPLKISEFVAVDFGFFTAGFETSSSTQTFALFELAKNLDCQTRLRNEINRVLKKHHDELSYDALMEMKYLENVIDETLRKYPILPLLPRLCQSNYPVPGTDLVLEKGTHVVIPLMGIHNDPEYYPNPEKFDPERFNSENKGNRPHVAYLPFGEGPRICIGKRFGLLQSKVGLVALIKTYEVTLNEKTSTDIEFVSKELILRKVGDIWINLKRIC